MSKDGKKDTKPISSGISLFKHSYIMKLSISIMINWSRGMSFGGREGGRENIARGQMCHGM